MNSTIALDVFRYNILETIILALTGIVVYFYTKETAKSNEISEKPLLSLILLEDKQGCNKSGIFILKNIGKGPAFNIKINKIITDEHTYTPRLELSTYFLDKNQQSKIRFLVRKPPRINESYDDILGFQLFVKRLFPVNANEEEQIIRSKTGCMFIISYTGMNNKQYYSLFRFYSKMYPLLGVNDFMIEYIYSGKKNINYQSAKKMCLNKELAKSIYCDRQ